MTLLDLVDAGPSGPASVTLRPYQQAIIEAIAASPSQRQLVQAATGVGKTVMFASLPQWPSIRARLGASPWAMLVIAHREELIDQAASKIAGQNPGLTVAVEQGDRYASVSSDVVVASVQTLTARAGQRLRRLMREKPFRLVIVDEAHHASATTYRAVLTTLGFLPPDLPITDASELSSALKAWDSSHGHEPRLLVGVTATPNRSDGVGLAAVFQSMVYTYPIRQAISDGWLVEIVAWAIETRESIDHVKTTAGEFNQKQLAEAVNTEARNRLAVTSWQQHAQGRQTIAFTVDVAHAHAAADTFTASGIPAMAVSGDTPKDDRRAILESYRNRRFQMLANCMILTEGTDLPETSCILHLKPTKSATLYEQMTGRGLRLFDRKTDCVVIDLVDVARKHSLLTAPQLFGLPPSLVVKGKKLGDIRQAWDDFQAEFPGVNIDAGRKTIEELTAIARKVNVWAVPDLGSLGTGLTYEWLRTGTDDYTLRFPWDGGNETIRVTADLVGQWSVSTAWKALDGSRPPVSPVTLAAGLSSPGEALRVAEGYATTHRSTGARIADKNAHWKRDKATDKQIALLRKFGAPIKPGLTKGEASNLLNLKFGRR